MTGCTLRSDGVEVVRSASPGIDDLPGTSRATAGGSGDVTGSPSHEAIPTDGSAGASPSLTKSPSLIKSPSLRITVLAGGPSAERSVSLQSGAAIAEALIRCGHQVTLADISPSELSALDHPADVVFSALHGTFGEDGQLQHILDQRGVLYVGSGETASAAAMDKWETKAAALRLGFKTAPAEIWGPDEIDRDALPHFGFPLVVKPVDQGSSVATYILKSADGFLETVASVVRDFGRALVERFIAGRELTVGVVGEAPLPPIWIRPQRAFYDFAAKYEDDATEYLFETGLSDAQTAVLQASSLRLFRALGCRHLARIDWIMDADQTPWLLEVNTLPGFTSHSLVPKAAARIGISFDQLVDRLARMALKERP